MTEYEIIMIFIGISGLMISACSLLIALLKYIHKKDNKHK